MITGRFVLFFYLTWNLLLQNIFIIDNNTLHGLMSEL